LLTPRRTEQEAPARLFAGLDGVGGADRFRNTPWREGVTGAPLLNTAICAIDCVLQQHHLVGSHGIFIGRMVATRQLCASSPVINFQGELRTLPLA
jgi:flavin reductase (DIM6/NTAB) family NADH-FMN oxidoreductase RutF